jgi:hypothetical protein
MFDSVYVECSKIDQRWVVGHPSRDSEKLKTENVSGSVPPVRDLLYGSCSHQKLSIQQK